MQLVLGMETCLSACLLPFNSFWYRRVTEVGTVVTDTLKF